MAVEMARVRWGGFVGEQGRAPAGRPGGRAGAGEGRAGARRGPAGRGTARAARCGPSPMRPWRSSSQRGSNVAFGAGGIQSISGPAAPALFSTLPPGPRPSVHIRAVNGCSCGLPGGAGCGAQTTTHPVTSAAPLSAQALRTQAHQTPPSNSETMKRNALLAFVATCLLLGLDPAAAAKVQRRRADAGEVDLIETPDCLAAFHKLCDSVCVGLTGDALEDCEEACVVANVDTLTAANCIEVEGPSDGEDSADEGDSADEVDSDDDAAAPAPAPAPAPRAFGRKSGRRGGRGRRLETVKPNFHRRRADAGEVDLVKTPECESAFHALCDTTCTGLTGDALSDCEDDCLVANVDTLTAQNCIEVEGPSDGEDSADEGDSADEVDSDDDTAAPAPAPAPRAFGRKSGRRGRGRRELAQSEDATKAVELERAAANLAARTRKYVRQRHLDSDDEDSDGESAESDGEDSDSEYEDEAPTPSPTVPPRKFGKEGPQGPRALSASPLSEYFLAVRTSVQALLLRGRDVHAHGAA